MPPVCILAGGLGTRLGSVVADMPKPLLEVAGEPFLVHQLRLLARHGVTRAVICVGYRGQQIQAALGERQQGVAISYSFDGPQLDGTLGAIRRALPLLGERFLVLYGDTYLRMDYAAAVRIWQASERPALMAVLRNEGRWDTSNAVYADGMIARYRKADPSADMQWIDYGLGGLTVEALSRVAADERDLALLYTRLADGGELCGYEVAERFYEIGTPQAMAETDHFLGSLAREA